MVFHESGEFGVIASQAIGWGSIIVFLLVLAFAAGFAGLAIYRLLRYKIKVTILDHVGDTHLVTTDIAQEVNEKNGKNYLKLLKTKMRIPVPNPDKYLAMGIRKSLFLHKHNDLFTPLQLAHNSPAAFQFNMDDLVSVLFWREQDHQEALETYRSKPSFWDMYQTPILFGSFMIIQFVLFFVLFHQLGNLQIHVDTSQLVR